MHFFLSHMQITKFSKFKVSKLHTTVFAQFSFIFFLLLQQQSSLSKQKAVIIMNIQGINSYTCLRSLIRFRLEFFKDFFAKIARCFLTCKPSCQGYFPLARVLFKLAVKPSSGTCIWPESQLTTKDINYLTTVTFAMCLQLILPATFN